MRSLTQQTVGRNLLKTGDVLLRLAPTSVPFRSFIMINIAALVKLNETLFIIYSLQDPLTGISKQVMKTPYKKAHRIGGSLPVFENNINL